MAQEDQNEAAQQTASDEDSGTVNQASPCVIEIHDSTTECEEEPRPNLVQMEEKAFVSSLHSFMKDRGTPIERIPHLGFKQINLWRIYKAVEKLGGYDSVTARRYWKKVYDELGGSPGSTSAATCTRRHYERLVLPFERHIKGEEDKPLPPSKPRKPYKRNLDGKANKADMKRKRPQSDQEMDSELIAQRASDPACQIESARHSHSAVWATTSDRHHPDCSQPNRAPADLSVFAHLLPVSTSSPWTAQVPSAAGEVISPLEKKKRVAQASLNLPQSPQTEDKERPSVIHCSQSPARASSSRNCNSSDGSPLPLSSSSSRSPSPCSISSEDAPAGSEDKPASVSELTHNSSSTIKNASSSSEDSKSLSCGDYKYVSHISPQFLFADSVKSQTKDIARKQSQKESSKYSTYPFYPATSFTEKPDWAPKSTSSFTKVIPKSGPLLRPAPVWPSYKLYQNKIQQDDTCAKKMNNGVSWIYPTEKREKSRTVPQKVPPTQQSLSHPSTTLPVSCVLSNYDKSGRDSRQSPLYPAFLSNRLGLPQSQLMYRHVPMGPTHPAVIGPAGYPYYYPLPLLNSQPGYALPAMNAIYSHKL
ncbi:hypothetical protein Q5P01_014698 [Channa striata]|uniref:ARID domain-containing protein n=1 Tax=Channa striata TaxID=64152 RepID=A0AA88SH07_CHASR|nr:hypothetical protein Q5P01_014698 [Channa striata]